MPAVLHAVSTLCTFLALSGALVACKLYNPALIEKAVMNDAGVVHAPAQLPATTATPTTTTATATTSCELAGCTKLPQAGPPIAEEDGGIEPLDGNDAGVVDLCPADESKTRPGICGCGNTDLDSDLDGTLDCVDDCPYDAAKTTLGACGCEVPDVDSDEDGTRDCIDACPRDVSKTTTGACSCGVAEADRDADGTADCLDHCPDDFAKTEPGACGCAEQDPTNPSAGAIYCARSALRHRYSFNGAGDTALDSVAGADARLFNNALQQDGSLALPGGRAAGILGDSYAALPPSVSTGLTSATFEAWFIWRGVGDAAGNEWQRIFDLGREQDDGMTRYWFLSPLGAGGVRTAFSLGGPIDQEVNVTSPQPAPSDVAQHVACVIDAPTSTLSLFYDGTLQGSVMLPGTLSDIAPDSLWLGRSHFQGDPAFHGEVLEFRIYAAALSSAQLQASATAGPEYDFAP